MEFRDLNIKEQKDTVDLMCILSANVNHLYSKDDRPERTEEEILNTTSDKVKKYWGEFLLLKLKGE